MAPLTTVSDLSNTAGLLEVRPIMYSKHIKSTILREQTNVHDGPTDFGYVSLPGPFYCCF